MSARTICSIACVAVIAAATPLLARVGWDPERSAAGAQSASQAPALSDATLTAQIADAIRKDSTLNKYALKVTVDNGVATITGAVRSDADRGKASQVATITGISRIDNQVKVDPSTKVDRKGTTGAVERKTKQDAGKVADKTKEAAGVVADKSKEGAAVVADKSKEGAEKTKDIAKEGAEKTKDAAEKVYDKSKEGAETVADKTKQGVGRAGEAIADTYITSRVKTEFIGRDVLKDSDIKVETDNHVVTLSGTVMTEAGRDKAIELAKTVDGVSSVVDHMTIGPKKK